jgi:NADH-quinone oxidoreductase subunit C
VNAALDTSAATRSRVESALAGIAFTPLAPRDGIATYEIAPAALHEACRRLRDQAGFETNTFVTAIDRFPKEPRFELLHQFLSVAHNDRVRLVAHVRSDAGPSGPEIASIGDLWPGTSFSERECYDMFGIVFTGHPALKRLMMPEDYDHFPLRKDFPHQGIEPDRLYRLWEERRRARGGEHHAPRHPEDEPRVPPHELTPRS